MASTLSEFQKLLNAKKFSQASEMIRDLPAADAKGARKNLETHRKLAAGSAGGGGDAAGAQRQNAAWTKGIALGKDYVGALENINLELVKANANFATNAQAQTNLSIKLAELQTRNVSLGLGIQQLSKIYTNLSTTLAARVLPGFDKSAIALTDQVAVWGKLGIATDDSRYHIDLFHTVLGKTVSETSRVGRVFNEFARTTGQDFGKVWKDFGANAEHFLFMVDSNRMVRTGLVMQARARAMGTSVSNVMGLLDKFETMDSAQQHGAKLNTTLTALGGSFDAVKASSMDYAERQEYIAKSLQSVFPRIQAAGPRAARLYMRSLRESTGMSAKDLQAMMCWKPGQELPGVSAAARGVGPMAAMAPGTERAAGVAATTAKEAGAAALQAATNMAVVTLKKAGLGNLPMAIRTSTRAANVALQAVSTAGMNLGNLGGKEAEKFFKNQPWYQGFDKMFGEKGAIHTLTDVVEDFNTKQRIGNKSMADWHDQLAKALVKMETIVKRI